MAKILLTRPGIDRFTDRRRYVSDLGLGFLAGSARRAGHEVDVIDLNRPGVGAADFESLCRTGRYDLVGFKVFSNETHLVRPLLRILRAVSPDSVSVIGGHHATGLGEAIFATFPKLDLALFGEGEIGLPRLAALAEGGRQGLKGARSDLGDVPGLVYRNGEGTVCNLPERVRDLDSLGFPDFAALNTAYFARHDASAFGPYLPLMTGRGCPMPCTFCSAHLVSGKQRRHHSLDYLMDYLRITAAVYGARSFTLADDHFLADVDFAQAFCERLAAENLGLYWHCASNGVRADRLNAELVGLMERSGCRYVGLGIESWDQQVLDSMRKVVLVKDIQQAVDLIRRHTNMKVFGYHILGYPGEMPAQRQTTVRRALQSKLSFADFLLFQPLPGSKAGDRILDQIRKGTAGDVPFDYDIEPTLADRNQARVLKRFQRRAYVRFYLRPRILLDFLVEILRGRYSWWFLSKSALSVLRFRSAADR